MSLLEPKCRQCGCTQERACLTVDGPCYWAEPDLCSACAQNQSLSLTEMDLLALEAAPPISIEMSATQALMLMSALQLALRHEGFAANQPTRKFVEWITRGLADYAGLTPNLKALCEEGWRQNQEPPKHSRLILPPG